MFSEKDLFKAKETLAKKTSDYIDNQIYNSTIVFSNNLPITAKDVMKKRPNSVYTEWRLKRNQLQTDLYYLIDNIILYHKIVVNDLSFQITDLLVPKEFMEFEEDLKEICNKWGNLEYHEQKLVNTAIGYNRKFLPSGLVDNNSYTTSIKWLLDPCVALVKPETMIVVQLF